jgi:hypothetical protein
MYDSQREIKGVQRLRLGGYTNRWYTGGVDYTCEVNGLEGSGYTAKQTVRGGDLL